MGQNFDCFNVITRQVNVLFANKEPWQVASITAISLMTTIWFWEQIVKDESKCAFLSVSSKQINIHIWSN